MDIFEHKHFTR